MPSPDFLSLRSLWRWQQHNFGTIVLRYAMQPQLSAPIQGEMVRRRLFLEHKPLCRHPNAAAPLS